MEVAEHSCYDFAWVSHVVADGFVGDFEDVAVFEARFFEEEGGEAFVEAFPEYLFEEPDDFGEAGRHEFASVVGDGGGRFHHFFVCAG